MPKITEMWAWITEDSGPDDEGVIGFMLPSGQWMPLVGADGERMASYKDHAYLACEVSGTVPKLVRFTTREEMDAS